jgi:hypothetical protein
LYSVMFFWGRPQAYGWSEMIIETYNIGSVSCENTNTSEVVDQEGLLHLHRSRKGIANFHKNQ